VEKVSGLFDVGKGGNPAYILTNVLGGQEEL
jgi:hypothetical protein